MIKYFVLKHEKYKRERIGGGVTCFRDDLVMMVGEEYFSYDHENLRWERDPNLDQDPNLFYKRYNEVDGHQLQDALTVYAAKQLLME